MGVTSTMRSRVRAAASTVAVDASRAVATATSSDIMLWLQRPPSEVER